MKNKETIKEAAERYSIGIREENYKDGFIDGAKWQNERSYSEKELIEILGSYAEWSIEGDCTYAEWLEQHKK